MTTEPLTFEQLEHRVQRDFDQVEARFVVIYGRPSRDPDMDGDEVVGRFWDLLPIDAKLRWKELHHRESEHG